MVKSVSFGTVEIREYPFTIGDHPSVHGGVPLTMEWHYNTETVKIMSVYDLDPSLSHRKEDNLVLSSWERARILKDLGFTKLQLTDAMLRAQQDRLRRQESTRQAAWEELSLGYKFKHQNHHHHHHNMYWWWWSQQLRNFLVLITRHGKGDDDHLYSNHQQKVMVDDDKDKTLHHQQQQRTARQQQQPLEVSSSKEMIPSNISQPQQRRYQGGIGHPKISPFIGSGTN
jgi:hypothetical protein